VKRLLVLALLAASCASAPPNRPAPPPMTAPAALAPPPMPAGLDAAALDPSANPCDDFYQFACGGWLKATPIPPDRSVWGRGFNVIEERNEQTLKEILELIAEGKPPPGTPYAKQLGDYYATCMDESKLDSALPELRTALRRLDRVSTSKQVATEVARLHDAGADVLFAYGSTQDFKDATQVIGVVAQGGLGLPDRDYYLSDAPKMKEIREGYRAYVAQMFGLLGDPPAVAAKKANQVLEVETKLAQESLDRVSLRDPNKVYHRKDPKALAKVAPGFDWNQYFTAVGTPGVQVLNVSHPPFATEVGQVVRKVPRAQLRNYFAWRLISSQVIALPKPFADAQFAFNSKFLTGAKEDRPRWKKCVAATDLGLGEALAVPYVNQTFGADGKAVTKAMVDQIEQAFDANLDTLSWMDAATKARAREKAKAVFNKIGYPDKWKTYDGLVTDRGTFLGNHMRAMAYENARDLKKIGKPLDRTEWLMTPPTVNAYYQPPMNEIVFPAGILQPPFFAKDATDAVNFGAMGMVVGHELTHGFDDEGRQFDAKGNLTDWWTPESGKAFVDRVSCVKNQFDGYVAIDDLHVNGALTLGENVADLGGLKLAFAAMQAYAKAHPDRVAAPSRFTPEQQFFLGNAQAWCTNIRPEEARRRVTVDPHSPPRYRVNGPLSNLPQFQQAFGCKAGDRMVAQNRCEVW
jgi:endothelin-converting enzyme/putative endopeptidase